jgi:hypothetical protein
MTDDAVRGHMARVADWFTVRESKKGQVSEDDAPPMEVVKDLVALPGWPGVPPIRTVVNCPVFTRDGELVDRPGYHAGGQVWYDPTPGLMIPPVAERPTAEDVARARTLIVDELLGDFPFVGDASKANAVALLLLFFVREMIDGATPLHLIDAPTPGTGKTLLVNTLSGVPTGCKAAAMSEGKDQDEWRKRIFATLCEAPACILLDNLRSILDSAALASALTAEVFKDRILGVSKMATVPVRCVWMATGNNTELSYEMMRRTALVRIDAKKDQPWKGRKFKHRLPGWARENRGELVWAALTLCRAWLAAGGPHGKQEMGMFECWAETMGAFSTSPAYPGSWPTPTTCATVPTGTGRSGRRSWPPGGRPTGVRT